MGQSLFENRSVFVSSTFRDMQAERDMIRDVVLTELGDYADSLSMNIDFVDLRWGISTVAIDDKEEKERLVLKVCLDRLDETRPFMIVLLGDRYGWIPDSNLLEDISAEKQFVPQKAKSVTALEIEYALLSDKEFMQHCFFYFRNPLPYDEMDAAYGALYSDAYTNPESVVLLHDLKEDIRKRYPNKVREYSVNWDAQSKRITGFGELSSLILSDLKKSIDEEAVANPISSDSQKQLYEIEAFFEKKKRGFGGRANILDQLLKFSLKDDGIFVLVADAGLGKSAIAAKVYETLTSKSDAGVFEYDNVLTLPFACGISAGCSSPTDMLVLWIELLNDVYEQENDRRYCSPSHNDAFSMLVDWFEQLLFICSSKHRIVLLIDAINQFGTDAHSINLDYLPIVLPKNIAVLITCTKGKWLENLSARKSKEIILDRLSEDEIAEITKGILSLQGKTHISKALIDELSAKPNSDSPLLLSAYLQNLLALDENDFAKAADQYKGMPDDEVNERMLLQVVAGIPESTEQIYPNLIQKACQRMDPKTVELCMGLIAMSQFGLRDKDIERAFVIEGLPFVYADFFYMIKRFKLQFRQDADKAWSLQHRLVIDSINQYYLEQKQSLQMLLARIFESPDIYDQFEIRSAFVYFLKANRIGDMEALIQRVSANSSAGLGVLIRLGQQLVAADDTRDQIIQMMTELYGRQSFADDLRVLPFITGFLTGLEQFIDIDVLRNFLGQLEKTYKLDKFIKNYDIRVAKYISVRAELESVFGNLNMAKNMAQFSVTVGEKTFEDKYFPIVYKWPLDLQFGSLYPFVISSGNLLRTHSHIEELGVERINRLSAMDADDIWCMKRLLLEINQLIMAYARIILKHFSLEGQPERARSILDQYESTFMAAQSNNERDDQHYFEIMKCRLGLCCAICSAYYELGIFESTTDTSVSTIYFFLCQWNEFMEHQKKVDDPVILCLLGDLHHMGASALKSLNKHEQSIVAMRDCVDTYKRFYRIASGLEQLLLYVNACLDLGDMLKEDSQFNELEQLGATAMPYIQLLENRYSESEIDSETIRRAKDIFIL